MYKLSMEKSKFQKHFLFDWMMLVLLQPHLMWTTRL